MAPTPGSVLARLTPSLPAGIAPRVAGVLLFLLICVTFIARGPIPALREKGRATFDFGPIYGGTRAWFHGRDAYDTPTVHAEFYAGGGDEIRHPHGYFPPLMPIAAIAAWAPWPTARIIWLAISLAAWAATIGGILMMVDWQPSLRWIPPIWGLLCWPAVMNIKMGQPATLCCAFAVWSIYFAARNRFIAGGVALGLALGCKPTLAAAAVFFCLVQKKFRTLAVGLLTLAIVYAGVLATALPGSLHWLNEQQTNLFAEFHTVSSPLPSGIQVTDFVNLQTVVAMFTDDLTLGTEITFVVVGALLTAFYRESNKAGSDGNWPAAVTLSVSLGLLVIYHRYPDLFLLAAILPVCYVLYAERRYRLLAIVSGIVAILSIPLQTELSQKLMLPPLRSHHPLEVARVLLLLHHQTLLLLTLVFLSFRMLVGRRNPRVRRNIRPG